MKTQSRALGWSYVVRSRLPSFYPTYSVPITGRLVCLIVTAACLLPCSIAVAQNTGAVTKAHPTIQQVLPAPSQTSSNPQAKAAPPSQGRQSPAESKESEKDLPEISTQEATATIRVSVNLVEVRVVVRDAQGRAVRELKKEDFQLLDNGTPQTITKFSVEQPVAKPVLHQGTSASNAGENPERPPLSSTVPERYIAYLWDDVHLDFGSLAQASTAAARDLETLAPTERIAIYTTSGQTQIDFTDDRAKLRDALNHLKPRPITSSGGTNCPHMSYYMADLIQNRQDTQALSAATQDALDCAFSGKDSYTSSAEQMAKNAARQQLYLGAHETHIALDALRTVVRRIAAMPGGRTIILISPGFLNHEQRQEEFDIGERALHSNIVINTLDARGLYTLGDDASKATPFRHLNSIAQNVDEQYLRYSERERSAQADVLREVATATGGKFFQNRNDLGEGFRQLAGAPEYSYLLGFSPRDLKLDGSFHNLKVTLKSRTLEIQARQGYYAPKQPAAAAEQAKRGTEDAVFSPARKTVADAQQLLTQGKDPEQGIKLLKKAIKQDPQYARAHLLMGVAYSSQSNWNEAEKSFLKAVDLDHDNAPAYVGLGAIENQRKNFPAAEKYLLEAVALVPDSADAHFELGRTYFAMGRWDAADQQVAKANQLRPTDPQQHVMMGDILLRQRNAEGALKEFQEALRLDSTGPLSEPTRQMIARIEEALKDEQDFRRRAGAALEALKQSLDSADGDADFEVEEKDGALHISFEEPPAKIVVSPNAQVRQIWISALSTSYRLDWSDERNDFVLLKTGEALKALVSRLIDEQLEEGTSSLQ